MTPLARNLSALGYAVWNIEYRRVGQEGGGWPGTLADAAAAPMRLPPATTSIPLGWPRSVTLPAATSLSGSPPGTGCPPVPREPRRA